MEKKNERWGWKVLHLWRGKLRSATMPWKRGGIIYKEDQWVFPKQGCGPLCVFGSKKEAIAFVGVLLTKKVKYVPSKEKTVWLREGDYESLSTLPEGTRLAEAVFVPSQEAR